MTSNPSTPIPSPPSFPPQGININAFSVLFRGLFHFDAVQYRFVVASSDNVRLWLQFLSNLVISLVCLRWINFVHIFHLVPTLSCNLHHVMLVSINVLDLYQLYSGPIYSSLFQTCFIVFITFSTDTSCLV